MTDHTNNKRAFPLGRGIAACALLALAANAQQRTTVTAVPASGQPGQSLQASVAAPHPLKPSPSL